MTTKALVFCFGTSSNHSTFSELELVLYLFSSAVMLQLFYDVCTRPVIFVAKFCAAQEKRLNARAYQKQMKVCTICFIFQYILDCTAVER